MTEVRVVDEKSGGAKGSKPQRYSLIPVERRREWIERLLIEGKLSPVQHQVFDWFLSFEEGKIEGLHRVNNWLLSETVITIGHFESYEQFSEVYGFGAKKYKDEPGRLNYQRGYNYSLTIDSFWRHFLAHCRVDLKDAESQLPHLLHAYWHIATILEFIRLGVGTDDRCYKIVENALLTSKEAA